MEQQLGPKSAEMTYDSHWRSVLHGLENFEIIPHLGAIFNLLATSAGHQERLDSGFVELRKVVGDLGETITSFYLTQVAGINPDVTPLAQLLRNKYDLETDPGTGAVSLLTPNTDIRKREFDGIYLPQAGSIMPLITEVKADINIGRIKRGIFYSKILEMQRIFSAYDQIMYALVIPRFAYTQIAAGAIPVNLRDEFRRFGRQGGQIFELPMGYEGIAYLANEFCKEYYSKDFLLGPLD